MTEVGVVEKKNRISTVDIAKGIGIALVVWAHAKGIFSAYIYQFHMPFFFLISGYLYSRKSSLGQFFFRKVKSLYIPFVVWNVIFTVIEAATGIVKYSNGGLKEEIIKILLTLKKNGQFLGATWFLGALFVVSLAYKVLDQLVRIKYKRIVITVLFIGLAILGFSVNFDYMFSRTLVLSAYYAIGVLVKELITDRSFFKNKLLALGSFLIFAIIGHFNSANMGANEYTYPVLFFIGALLASYVFVFISEVIDAKTIYIKRMLIYLGKNSLPILIWQFVAFRIVIMIQLLIANEPIRKVLEYYPVYSVEQGWWLAYFIVGMAVPLIWDKFLKDNY